MFGMEMFYNRMDPEDRRRIVFREGMDTRDNEDGERCSRAKYGAWRRNLQFYLEADEGAPENGGRHELTPYIASIYGASLDCELPGLRYDVQKKEVSFEWDEFLAGFCKEYKELERRRMAVVPKLEAMVEDVDPSSFMDTLGSAFLEIVANRRVVRKHVRRERIMNFYKEKHGLDMRVELMDLEHEKYQLERLEAAEGAHVGMEMEDEEGFDDEGGESNLAERSDDRDDLAEDHEV